jgi:hypothetical protein
MLLRVMVIGYFPFNLCLPQSAASGFGRKDARSDPQIGDSHSLPAEAGSHVPELIGAGTKAGREKDQRRLAAMNSGRAMRTFDAGRRTRNR